MLYSIYNLSSHLKLDGLFDGTFVTPNSCILDNNVIEHPNSSDFIWLCLDQLLR